MEVETNSCIEMHALDPRKSLISPVVKSRGARFLDMVRQNNINTSPSSRKSYSGSKSKENKDGTQNDQTYFKFSSEKKFNPKASPSSSILIKRKASIDAIATSPFSFSAKKKRVGFQDPVSTTKEYLITVEEERQKSNKHLIRCLKYDNVEKLEDEIVAMEVIENKPVFELESSDEDKPVFELESSDEDNPQNTAITTTDDSLFIPEPIQENQLIFKDKQELLDYIGKNITVDELLESLNKPEVESTKHIELVDKVVGSIEFTDLLDKYIPKTNSESNKLTMDQNSNITCIINKVSKMMQSNNTIKHKVLDILSEKHSSEFLEHALQENSTNRICDKLGIKSVVNHIIHKVNVGGDDDVDSSVEKLNTSLIHHLVNNTAQNDRGNLSTDQETHDLLTILFKNKPKIDIFDTIHEFLRNVLHSNA
ncbi:unnamed protein product [Diamesa serratosioi]